MLLKFLFIKEWIQKKRIKLSTKTLSSTTVFKIDKNVIDNIHNVMVLLYYNLYLSIFNKINAALLGINFFQKH